MSLHRFVSSGTLAALLLGCAVTILAQAPDAAQPVEVQAAQATPVDAAPPAAQTPAAPAPAPRQPRATPQPAPEPPPLPDFPPFEDPDFDPDEVGGDAQEVVRVGQDFTLAAGEEARSVVVIMGNATVDGHVRELVVVMGTIRLGPNARVDRDIVSVMGGVTVTEGAVVGREMVVIGGSLDAPPSFNPGRQHVVINPPFLGTRMNAVVPYFTQGLMWGRVIVPSLGWLWAIVGVFFIVYLVVNLLVDGPVRAAAAVVEERTLTSFGTGLLVLILFGPVSFLLAVSVVGLLVIPVLICALLAAALVGKVATFRWLGSRVWRSEDTDPTGAAVTFAIGFAIVTLVYMVPVLGMIGFALLSVLGLGAASLAFVSAYRREQPPPAPVVPPPPVPPTPPLDTASFSGGTDVPAIPMSSTPPPVASAPHEVSALPRGAFRDRLAAFVLDLILVVLVVQVAWPFRGPRIFFLALLAYHIGFWAWKHTTVGGIICQLRIVRVDGVPLTVADAFIRGLSGIFSVVVLGLGFFWILRDPERQSWHDKIAGTYVVKVPKNFRF